MPKFYYCEECDLEQTKKNIDQVLDFGGPGTLTRETEINGKPVNTEVAQTSAGHGGSKGTLMVSKERDGYYCHGRMATKGQGGSNTRTNRYWHEPKKMRKVEVESPTAYYITGALISVLSLVGVAVMFYLEMGGLLGAVGIFAGILAGAGVIILGYRGLHKKVKEEVKKKKQYGFQPEQQAMDSYEDMQQSRQPRQPRQPSQQTEDSETPPPPPPGS